MTALVESPSPRARGLKHTVARAVFWLAWSRGVLQLASLATTIFVARLLHPSDYGLMAIVSVCTATIGLLAESGLGGAIIQFRDLDRAEVNACFWSIMVFALAGYGALVVSAPTLSVWFGIPRLASVLPVASLSLILISLRVVPDATLRKDLALHRLAQAEMAGTIMALLVIVALALRGAGVWALVAGELTTRSVQTALTFAFAPWRPGLRIGGPRFRAVMRYSFSILGARACTVAYQQIDVLVLGRVAGDVVLGTYTVGKQLALLGSEKITEVVNQVVHPMMASLQDQRAALRASLLRGLRLVSSVTFPLTVGGAVLGHELVTVTLTSKWEAAIPIFQLLSLYALARAVAVLLPPVLLARFRARFMLGYGILLVAVLPLTFLAGALWWDAVGVAVVWVVVYPLLMAWMAREALREADVSVMAFLAELRPAVIATVAMAVGVAASRLALVGSAPALRLALLVPLGTAIYFVALLLARAPVVAELKEVAGWLTGRHRRVWASASKEA